MKNGLPLAAVAAVILLSACAPEPPPPPAQPDPVWLQFQAANRARAAGDATAADQAARALLERQQSDNAAAEICRQRAGVQATMVRGGVLYQIAAERQFAATCLETYRRTGVMPTL